MRSRKHILECSGKTKKKADAVVNNFVFLDVRAWLYVEEAKTNFGCQ